MRPNSLHVDSLAGPRWLLLVCAVLLLSACQSPPPSPAASFKKEVKGILDKLCADLSREFNPVVYPPDEFKKKTRENHHFITEVIRGAKIWLIGNEEELAKLVA